MINIPKNTRSSNKLTLLSESFHIEEAFAPTTEGGKVDEKAHKVYLVGKALTFGKPTRNKVAYTHESGLASLDSWKGRPFLNSHKDEDVLSTIGHVEKMEIRPDDEGRNSLFYKVDVDPAEEKFIRKAKRGDIPYVSVQVLVSDVRQKETMEFGNYIEADIKEGLELSSVLIPGERETNGYITEERFAESFLGKEQYPDAVEDIKKNEQPMTKKGDTINPNASIVPVKATTQEDISMSTGDGLVQDEDEAKKIKKAEEPKNKITPDLIPRRMISMQSLDTEYQKKTNVADETQEEQEADYKYNNKEPAVKYYQKGGNNIPAVPLKGYKAESISTIIECCGKPMFVMKNRANNIALMCEKCGKNIVKNEKFWKDTNTYIKEKLKIKEDSQMENINKQPVNQQPMNQQPIQQAIAQQIPAQGIPVQQQPVQQPVQQVPMGQAIPGQVPASPVPSTTPELEQILVKLQELEQRVGEQEMQNANQVVQADEGKFENLKSKKEDITGEPELVKKQQSSKQIGPEATNEVPKAQTSEIDFEDGGTKDGAPVAGEETGLNKGEPSEDDAIAKVPKPKKELPKMPIIKNALEGADGGVPVPGTPSKKPNKMEDEEGNKMPKNTSDGFEEKSLEEHYNYIKEKLQGRKSTVGAFASSEAALFSNTRNDTNSVIKEYLRKSNVRI